MNIAILYACTSGIKPLLKLLNSSPQTICVTDLMWSFANLIYTEIWYMNIGVGATLIQDFFPVVE